MLRQIVLDTETTGLSPEQGHRIIEVGCLELVNRRITGDYYHCYVNPKRDIDPGAVKVHGLTVDFLRDKPVFAAVADELIHYIKDAELIIHNAPFDVGFLNYEFSQLRKNKVTDFCGVIDTLALARRKYPGQHNNLDALCRRLSVDNSNRDLHGALIDAELLAQVYLLMTGGQTQLFQDEEAEKTTSLHGKTATTQSAAVQAGSLPVILPNETELQAHAAFLKTLRKKGACVWDEVESPEQ